MGWSMGTMQAATTPYTPAGTQDMAAKPGIPVIFVSSMRERRAFLCLQTYNYITEDPTDGHHPYPGGSHHGGSAGC